MRKMLSGFGAMLISGTALAAPADAPGIAMNQLGFQTGDAKVAVVERAGAAVPWRLVDAGGRTVASGMTAPRPRDESAGKDTQTIDFSGFRGEGEGYLLVAGGLTSRPFAIRGSTFAPLARDALAFFYHQRAGVAIEARYAGGARWARPVAHAPERATCFAGADQDGVRWPGCAYTLDVTGGWYDAGDHGKYVVNGGISLWTLLNAYERGQRIGSRPFADGTLPIPEAGNGVSDLLDHARYEMAFLLAMQVPDGAKVAVPLRGGDGKVAVRTIDAGGMAHHKVADEHWTALPMPPHLDRERRFLYPPSTAATLNLAAVAAQCARVWRGIDDAFAERCRTAAQKAWDAAARHPDLRAIGNFTGSGGYGDDDLSDELWWAAAELHATTGDERYSRALRSSPHWQSPLGDEPGWGSVGPLGTITLATVAGALPGAEVARMKAAVVAAADRFLGDRDSAGYAIPFAPTGWSWGSTSNLLNRAVVLGVAGDLTGDAKYRAGVVDAVDYVLGRNPLDQSYVSGYGARPMRHPHHRFWANILDPKLPPPPPGVLSGGPNSTAMVDTVAARMKGKCAAQQCWADDINAYALNEVAINWNAPLVWAAAYLSE